MNHLIYEALIFFLSRVLINIHSRPDESRSYSSCKYMFVTNQSVELNSDICFHTELNAYHQIYKTVYDSRLSLKIKV